MFQELLQYVQIIYKKIVKKPISQIKNGGVQIVLPSKMGVHEERDALYHELSHIYRGDLFKYNNDLLIEDYKEPIKSLLHGKLPFIYDSVIDYSLLKQDEFYNVQTLISHKGKSCADYTVRELSELIANYIEIEINKQGGKFKESFTIPITIDKDQKIPMQFDLEQTQNQYQNGSHTESEEIDENGHDQMKDLSNMLKDIKSEIDFAQTVCREKLSVGAKVQTVSIPKLISLMSEDVETDLYETSIIHTSNLNPERFAERPIYTERINIVLDVSKSMIKSLPYCVDIIKRLNTQIKLIIVDDKIQDVRDIPPSFRGKLDFTGGGGTDLNPAFQYIKDNRWEKYRTLVITDLDVPEIKVDIKNRIWLAYYNESFTDNRDRTAPKGEKIYAMNDDEIRGYHVKK